MKSLAYKCKRKKNSKGFTLIEMLLVLTILSLIIFIGNGMLSQTYRLKLWSGKKNDQIELVQHMISLLERDLQHLRVNKPVIIKKSENGCVNLLTFYSENVVVMQPGINIAKLRIRYSMLDNMWLRESHDGENFSRTVLLDKIQCINIDEEKNGKSVEGALSLYSPKAIRLKVIMSDKLQVDRDIYIGLSR
ncbi:PulJ/GspJ family protein [Serratia quinivorans]|uniref:PulJ/GspJ family protein n=1 Tax=Serratia quinivorans TaxID=137545 RepID=UPI00217872BE|nr:prepilin-type N-terminal cleavage/methylation domain-containing protein [Serratia quinivorans]CAI1114632.1 Type II secretory pathway, component PulJ [Serratia quinivorans]CAI1876065.1 Type II secretory pathway, component PulJ [Serratia quinivorans]